MSPNVSKSKCVHRPEFSHLSYIIQKCMFISDESSCNAEKDAKNQYCSWNRVGVQWDKNSCDDNNKLIRVLKNVKISDCAKSCLEDFEC